MGILILALVILSFARIERTCGLFSWTSAGAAAFFVYSTPAIIGLQRHFYYYGQRYLAEADPEAVLVILVAWGFFTLALFSLPLNRVRHLSAVSPEHPDYFPQIISSLVLALIGVLYLMYDGGIFFFLASRDEQVSNYFTLVWRWCIVIGFTASLLVGRRIIIALFVSLLALIFVQGDRTVFAIAAAIYILLAVGRAAGDHRMAAVFRSPKNILLVIAIFIAVLFGKPIYLSIKDLSLDPLLAYLEVQNLETIAMSAEPFVTFTHIDAVIRMRIEIPFRDFFISVFGNLLLVPSAFGVETNLYNEALTARLPSMVRYGVAGNYWAHGMAVGGLPGVACFACLYAGALGLLDRTFIDPEGRVRLGLALIASATAVYLQRNGIDNFLSFVRQIILAWLAVHLLSLFFRSSDHSSASAARDHV